jgi:stage II sporulation protein D
VSRAASLARCAALACLAAACAMPPRAPRARPDGQAAAPAAPPRATVRRASGTVDVRLSRWDGAPRVEFTPASGRKLAVERRGDGVALGAGEPAPEIVLPPASRTLGDARYTGALVVRPRAAGGLEISERIDLEPYVAGVVAAEIAVWSASAEELRAQAIASRSYAVAALDERGRKSAAPYVVDGVRDQAYRGVPIATSAAQQAAVDRLARAVESTRGLVLVEGERVVDARFHAACGGATADSRAIFPEADFAALRSVACEPCARAADGTWSETFAKTALDALAARLGVGGRVVKIEPAAADASGRWLEVDVAGDSGEARVPFERLRRELGPGALASSRVSRTWPRPGDTIEAGWRVDGRGRGHGVGLCQRGCRELARAGWTAERILAHYYPGTRIEDRR